MIHHGQLASYIWCRKLAGPVLGMILLSSQLRGIEIWC